MEGRLSLLCIIQPLLNQGSLHLGSP